MPKPGTSTPWTTNIDILDTHELIRFRANLTSVTLPYVQSIATAGVDGACEIHPELSGGINAKGGKLTCKEVGEAHDLPVEAFRSDRSG